MFVALVPLGLLAAFGPRIVRRHFQSLSQERVSGVLEAVARDLDREREGARVQASSLASDPALVRLLALAGPGGVPQIALIDFAVERLDALGVDWLEITGPDGVVLARGHDRGSFGLNLSSDPLIAGALTGQPLSAFVPLVPPDSGLALLAAAPVTFEGRVLGTVRVGPLLDSGFVLRLRNLSGAHLAVVGPSERLFVSSFPADGRDTHALARAAAAAGPESTATLTLSGVPYRMGGLELEDIGGAPAARLAVGVSEADLNRTLVSLLRLLGAAGLIALFVAVCIGLVFAYRISRPVRALALAAQRVSHGDLAVRLPAGPADEVGELMASFNTMTVDLQGARDRLLRGERQAAWAQIARRLAHEIKNPLTPIQLAIEDVERSRQRGDADLDQSITRAAQTIKAEVRTLRELVREFNDFARSPAPRPEPVDVNELLDRAIDLYVPSTVEVRRDYAFAPARVTADPDLLARAFGNLVKNACEAMDGRGEILLETRGDSDGVTVAVADTGPGIAEEDRDRIFTPYFTTKTEGTGLGLTVVRRVVEDHGGTLDLAPGGPGARFIVRLPSRVGGMPHGMENAHG
ncbi:MAG: ATP-binding protein [Candidatus Eiseniibacteriota bacterium]